MGKGADGSLGQVLQGKLLKTDPRRQKKKGGGNGKARMGYAVWTRITRPQKKVARLGTRSPQDIFLSICHPRQVASIPPHT